MGWELHGFGGLGWHKIGVVLDGALRYIDKRAWQLDHA